MKGSPMSLIDGGSAIWAALVPSRHMHRHHPMFRQPQGLKPQGLGLLGHDRDVQRSAGTLVFMPIFMVASVFSRHIDESRQQATPATRQSLSSEVSPASSDGAPSRYSVALASGSSSVGSRWRSAGSFQPLKLGLRFSAKARRDSIRSSLSPCSCSLAARRWRFGATRHASAASCRRC